MRTVSLLALLGTVLLCACGNAPETKYPYRWTYMSRNLSQDSHVDEVAEIAGVCAAHGLNGILLSCGADQLDIKDQDYIRRLHEVKSRCEELGVEIIPSIFSIGYGGSLMAHNPDLAAGIPVKDALYVVDDGVASLVPEPEVSIVNGGFENMEDGGLAGFDSPEKLGEVISRDSETVKQGEYSLRFENFGDKPEDVSSLSTEIAVTPDRLYRMSVWIKTEGLDPSRPFGSGNVRLQATAPDGRPLEWININMPPSADWVLVQEGFNSRGYDRVTISVSPRGRQQGRFWIDDLRVEEIGMVNLLRRPGTPVTVRGEESGTVYEEGVDYKELADEQRNFRFGHDGPSIELLEGSRIEDGERLRVSFYHGILVYDIQTPVCMSEPEVYEIWERNAKLIAEHLDPEMWFLHMDEIRAGGTCAACEERNLPMAEILGDCITRAHSIIRAADPDAEIFIWSDMIDPIHNASDKRPYYYHVDESFHGSWEHIPDDLVIACWWHRMRNESLAHFSGLGYRTIGAAYYDADDLEGCRDWIESLENTPGAAGIMYTTWLNKYELLDDFGDLVTERWGEL